MLYTYFFSLTPNVTLAFKLIVVKRFLERLFLWSLIGQLQMKHAMMLREI